jgi:hypothetical protein
MPSRREIRARGTHRRAVDDPLFVYNLLAVPGSVMGVQAAETSAVAKLRGKEAACSLEALLVDHPFGIRFGTDLAPDLFMQIARNCFSRGMT